MARKDSPFNIFEDADIDDVSLSFATPVGKGRSEEVLIPDSGVDSEQSKDHGGNTKEGSVESPLDFSHSEEESSAQSASIISNLWYRFIQHTKKSAGMEKAGRVYIAKDLTLVLDACPIPGVSRTEIVNAILRTFIEEYKDEFVKLHQTSLSPLFS